MSNMRHCRFRNALADLRDCYDAMDEPLALDETKAREQLIALCAKIADEYGAD
jgi:hypothetical protein